MDDVIYKAGFAWKGKTLAVLGSSFVGLMWGSHLDFLFRHWQASGLLGRAGVVISLLIIPLLPLEVFLKRTLFTQTMIEHRTMFGVKTAWGYSSVEMLLLSRNSLEICFRGGRKLTIWSSEGDLESISSIIEERAGKPIYTGPGMWLF